MTFQDEVVLLDAINKSHSVITLLRSGYSYSKVFHWCYELQSAGMIISNEDGSRELTKKGVERLNHIKNKSIVILPLEGVRVKRMDPEEVYLP